MRADGYVLELEKLFLGLGDKTRLRILNLIRNDEICVSYFTDVLGESQPKISRHLAYLRRAGLVTARREGTWMHYSIEWPEDAHTASMIEKLLEGLASQPEMQDDRARLIEALGSSAPAVKKEKPPKPKFTEAELERTIEYQEEPAPVYRDERRDDELETFLL